MSLIVDLYMCTRFSGRWKPIEICTKWLSRVGFWSNKEIEWPNLKAKAILGEVLKL